MKFEKAARGFVRRDLRWFSARWMAILVASFAGILSLTGCGGSTATQATPTPTLSPSGGTYTTSQTVTIADTASGAVFYCTTDGSTPTTSSSQCAEPTTVSKSETLNVIAVAPGMSASTAASGVYTINLPAAATPVISVSSGAISYGQTVTITDSASAAVIYYTVTSGATGTTPTTSSYTGAGASPISLTVSAAETIEAIAVESNYSDSAVATASYTIQPIAQTITYAPATTTYTYFSGEAIPLSATASSGLAVSFASTAPAVCSVSNATASILSGGTCSIQATQAGNADYVAAAPVSVNYTINPATQTITYAPSTTTYAYSSGEKIPLSATASSGLTVSFASTTPTICSVSGTTATILSGGTCTVQATQAGNADYSTATAVSASYTITTATQTINYAPTTTTYTYSSNGTIPLSATASSNLR